MGAPSKTAPSIAETKDLVSFSRITVNLVSPKMLSQNGKNFPNDPVNRGKTIT
jgi:hypothetical protein